MFKLLTLKLIAIVFFGLSLLGGSGTAQSGGADFRLRNQTPWIINLRFFSATRNVVWPPPDGYYYLDDDVQRSHRLNCEVGEKICYGGSWTFDDREGWWGVGFKGDKGCTDCCMICGANSTNTWHAWDLTGGGGGCTYCNDNTCQCGAGSNLCAGHGGEHPDLGCSAQPFRKKK